MATGAEILNYQGNAALGAGTAGGVGGLTEYGFGGIKEPLDGVNDMLKQQADHSMQWNAMEYAQKIKDRNDLYNLFAQNHVDFDTAEADRPKVQEQINVIKNMMTANPNLNDQANQAALRAQFNNLLAVKAAAKLRNADLVTKRNDIYNETNPVVRARRQKDYEEQAATDINTQIKPFQKLDDWSVESLFPKLKTKTVRREWTDAETGLKMEANDEITDMTEVGRIWDPATMTPTEKNNLAGQRDSWYKAMQTNPFYQDAGNIKTLNEKAAEINKATGAKKGDPEYLEPVGDYTFDRSGEYPEAVISLNYSPLQLGKTLHAIAQFSKTPGRAKPVTDVVEAQSKVADLGTKTTAAETAAFELKEKKRTADLKFEEARLKNQKEEEELQKNKTKRQGQENAAKKRAGKVRDLFHTALDDWRFTMSESDEDILLSDLQKNRVGVGTDWKIAALPDDATAMMILTSAIQEEDPITKKTVARKVPPDEIYIVQSPDKNPDNALLVGKYNQPPIPETVNGQQVMRPQPPRYKAYRRSQVGEHLIAGIMDYKTGQEYNEALEMYEWAYPGIISNLDQVTTTNPALNVPGNQKTPPPVLPPAGAGAGGAAGTTPGATRGPDTTGQSPTASGNQGGGGTTADLPPIPKGAIGKMMVTENGDKIPVIIMDGKIFNRATNSYLRDVTADEKRDLDIAVQNARKNRKK